MKRICGTDFIQEKERRPGMVVHIRSSALFTPVWRITLSENRVGNNRGNSPLSYSCDPKMVERRCVSDYCQNKGDEMNRLPSASSESDYSRPHSTKSTCEQNHPETLLGIADQTARICHDQSHTRTDRSAI